MPLIPKYYSPVHLEQLNQHYDTFTNGIGTVHLHDPGLKICNPAKF